jgi:hypothetical protein
MSGDTKSVTPARGVDERSPKHFYRSRSTHDLRKSTLVRDLKVDTGQRVQDMDKSNQSQVERSSAMSVSSDVGIFGPPGSPPTKTKIQLSFVSLSAFLSFKLVQNGSKACSPPHQGYAIWISCMPLQLNRTDGWFREINDQWPGMFRSSFVLKRLMRCRSGHDPQVSLDDEELWRREERAESRC